MPPNLALFSKKAPSSNQLEHASYGNFIITIDNGEYKFCVAFKIIAESF